MLFSRNTADLSWKDGAASARTEAGKREVT